MAHGQERLKMKIGDETPITPMRKVGIDARPFMNSSTLAASGPTRARPEAHRALELAVARVRAGHPAHNALDFTGK
jgi:hypothetical protein